MITIFTVPKPFTDKHVNIIQRNAIGSWLRLIPSVEIILIGNEHGVAEISKEFGLKHIPNVKVSEYGTPLLDSVFQLASENTENEILIYSNSDIIFSNSVVNILKNPSMGKFLLVGRRTDVEIENEINFNDPSWKNEVFDKIISRGKLHSPYGIDYFIFQKENLPKLPGMAVGRIGWDNWMIWNAKKKNLRLIDCTESIMAIHQNHTYPSFNIGAERKSNPEAVKNLSFLKGMTRDYSIEDADWIMKDGKIIKKSLNSRFFRTARKTLREIRRFLGL